MAKKKAVNPEIVQKTPKALEIQYDDKGYHIVRAKGVTVQKFRAASKDDLDGPRGFGNTKEEALIEFEYYNSIQIKIEGNHHVL